MRQPGLRIARDGIALRRVGDGDWGLAGGGERSLLVLLLLSRGGRLLLLLDQYGPPVAPVFGKELCPLDRVQHGQFQLVIGLDAPTSVSIRLTSARPGPRGWRLTFLW